MKQVNWGMIGCGMVTEVKSGPGLYKSENSNLVGVYNDHYERALDYTSRHGIEKTYRELEDLLTDEVIDVVYIATPPVFHYDYAIKVLEAGKIPYIEKPIASTYEQCLKIKELAEVKGLPVYAAFYRRGLEKFLKIKELIEDGAIGEIKYVYITQIMAVEDNELDKNSLPWRVQPSISGGGKFLDMGVHVLDCLILYFGEIITMDGLVENTGSYYDADDTVMATFKFKNGVVGSGTWCYVADKDINEVQIVGDKGRITYDGLSAKQFTIEKDGKEEVFEYVEPEHVAMPYQQAIVNELIGIEKSFADFDEAVNTVKVTEMLLDKFYKKGNTTNAH